MRIAVIGPRHRGGSLPPYLDVFATALRRCGQQVHRLGSRGLPYDPDRGAFWPAERILDAAEALLRTVDLDAYDLLSIHFGNLEIEQLLPALWAGRQRPPAIYHVHSLDWTLFTEHRPAPEFRAAVDHGIASMDGFVYFGEYARRHLAARFDVAAPHTTAWLPTTIPPNTTPALPLPLAAALGEADEAPAPAPVGSLYGYAAPWKDAPTLLAALDHVEPPLRIVLAGPFWNDPTQAGIDLHQAAARLVRRRGPELAVVADYLAASARQALMDASQLGLFVYRPQPTFQGSGALADYLANALPVLATDTANMTDLVGDAGIVVPPADPAAVADALDHMIGDRHTRGRVEAAARRRAHRFTAVHHATTCLQLYETVAATRHTGATR